MTLSQPHETEGASEVAATASDGAQPVLPQRKRVPNRESGPVLVKETDLRPRHKLIAQYMVHGVDHPSLARKVEREHAVFDPESGMRIGSEMKPVPVGEPLTLLEAASVANVRRRLARSLSQQPAFQRYLAKLTQAFREGAKARHWRNIDAIGMDPGLGKAADRKVQLTASQAFIGESEGSRSPSVSVTINNQHITPGYVIDLSPDEPATIEATANHPDSLTHSGEGKRDE